MVTKNTAEKLKELQFPLIGSLKNDNLETDKGFKKGKIFPHEE